MHKAEVRGYNNPLRDYIKSLSSEMIEILIVLYYAGRNGYFEVLGRMDDNNAREKLLGVGPVNVAKFLENGLKLWDEQNQV